MPPLPIDALEVPVLDAIERGNVVVSAPTASGKSTQVPRWLARRGRVLVVEPRRVACRALATRVAELEGARLGGRVGYAVRDDRRCGADTDVLFATPGVALRMVRDGLEGVATLVLDEFHERGLDTDLILALALRSGVRVLLTSATLDGERLAEHVGGPHLRGEGRQHPVDVEHLPGDALLPTPDGLEGRIRRALDRLDADGHVLVFLPGVAEIRAAAAALSSRPEELIPLHGGLGLTEQSRALSRGTDRRIYLATNVAETSLTLPGVVAVVDSGLVRRTRYHGGRAYLALGPIALDSAEQRAGRAGRLGPGRCVRLWSPLARLEDRTPPAVHRESLVPLVLAAAACGAPDLDLPWYDPPRQHAVDAARADLRALGALDAAGRLTERGEHLFALPTDPWLGRLLAEFEARGLAEHGVALAASLDTRRRLFSGPRPEGEDDLRAPGCDAVAGMRAAATGSTASPSRRPAPLPAGIDACSASPSRPRRPRSTARPSPSPSWPPGPSPPTSPAAARGASPGRTAPARSWSSVGRARSRRTTSRRSWSSSSARWVTAPSAGCSPPPPCPSRSPGWSRPASACLASPGSSGPAAASSPAPSACTQGGCWRWRRRSPGARSCGRRSAP